MSYDISSYDFFLPEKNIAQMPAAKREESRLLQLDCQAGTVYDGMFSDLLNLLHKNDILIVNDTKVFPARLLGKKETGGKIEFMLLHYPVEADKEAGAMPKAGQDGWCDSLVKGLLKSSIRPKIGSKILFGPDLHGVVVDILADATVIVNLCWCGDLDMVLGQYGEVPLPPYIRRESGPDELDRERYQTVYAGRSGAIAAPTAGLHFTDKLLAAIKAKGVFVSKITLHVGYGTFAPVRVDDIREHKIHSEYITVSGETRKAIQKARSLGGKVWAVGTTTTRALEFAADGKGGVNETQGACELYIYPGYEFKVVDNLITNFHLPKSSLLFMVSALAGREFLMKAYQEALDLGYRFYSYGDAMVVTNSSS